MHPYHIISLIKVFFGIAIMLIVYTTLNIYEDPIVGIGLWFLWLFIASRWLSYFIFLSIQGFYRRIDKPTLIKDSYKLSLLFGIYVMINVLLILLEYRSKFLWSLLFIWFILIQIALFSDSHQPDEHNDIPINS